MCSDINTVAKPPLRSLASPPDDSSKHSRCTFPLHPQQRPLPPIGTDNSTPKRHAKKQLKPMDSPPKNGLFVPKHYAHYVIKKKQKRKHKRDRKTAAGAVGGMVAGGLAFGPIGVVVGAAVGGFTSRQIAKKTEKRLQRKREQQSFRDFATSKGIQWSLNGDAAVFT